MFFESELSDKLNLELEAAGISVSEDLIARTLAAVQQARAEDKQTGLEQEIKNRVQTIAEARAGRSSRLSRTLFRAAGVIAACFVLVVGGFVLRFSTMRTGSDSAAPMKTAENASVRNGGTPDAGAAVTTDNNMVTYATEADMEDAGMTMLPTEGVADNAEEECVADNAEEECVAEADSLASQSVTALTEQLETAVICDRETTEQGTVVYRFVVEEADGIRWCYLVHENGVVEYAELMANEETGAFLSYAGSEDAVFRSAILEWLKESGY